MAHLDLVADILQRVADRETTLQPDDLREIEEDVRADWGGERHYVAKVGECGRMQLMRRDHEIREAAGKGVPEDYLSLRYGITVKRIRQILAAGNGLP